ncbi:hypothetical protein, partial [Anaerotignum lactatifermentans]
MKYKLALLLTLTMMMPTATTAFAAETNTETAAESTSEEGTVSTEESGVWQLTYEEALELAEDNSSDLDNVAEKAEYLQDLKEDIWDITGSFSVPTVSYQQWVDDEVYSIYSQIQSISSGMTQNRYTEEITKLTLESTVKIYFTSILSDESSLEVAKKEAEVKKTQYLQGQTKNKMGLISDYDLRTLETDYKTAVDNVETLERTIEEE